MINFILLETLCVCYVWIWQSEKNRKTSRLLLSSLLSNISGNPPIDFQQQYMWKYTICSGICLFSLCDVTFFCNFESWLWPHFASTAFNCLPWSIKYGAHRIDRYWPPTSGFLPKTNCEHRSFWCFHPSLNGLGYNNIHLNAINE